MSYFRAKAGSWSDVYMFSALTKPKGCPPKGHFILTGRFRRLALRLKEVPMDRDGRPTWSADLVDYFRELGGTAHYFELYRHIEANPRRKLGKAWQAVVRRTIEEHSSDTTIWAKRKLPDLFRLVDGLGAGRWALRAMDPDVFALAPGERIKRTELRLRYGGSPQGGIAPSRTSPNVFLFSDPSTGEEHGYFDGWNDDGSYHYTGTGQRGDQEMVSQNAATLHHKRDGRALRLFIGSRETVTYVGEFELDEREPFVLDYAPETGGGPTRRVIVFRLRCKGIVYRASLRQTTLHETHVAVVPVENQFVESMLVSMPARQSSASRTEAKLVSSFVDCLRSRGIAAHRHRIIPGTSSGPFLTDVYLPEKNLLVEAKGTSDREAFRMAVGRLLDYRRFLNDPSCAVLLPAKPSEDLLNFAMVEDIAVIWPQDDDFSSSRALF